MKWYLHKLLVAVKFFKKWSWRTENDNWNREGRNVTPLFYRGTHSPDAAACFWVPAAFFLDDLGYLGSHLRHRLAMFSRHFQTLNKKDILKLRIKISPIIKRKKKMPQPGAELVLCTVTSNHVIGDLVSLYLSTLHSSRLTSWHQKGAPFRAARWPPAPQTYTVVALQPQGKDSASLPLVWKNSA